MAVRDQDKGTLSLSFLHRSPSKLFWMNHQRIALRAFAKPFALCWIPKFNNNRPLSYLIKICKGLYSQSRIAKGPLHPKNRLKEEKKEKQKTHATVQNIQ